MAFIDPSAARRFDEERRLEEQAFRILLSGAPLEGRLANSWIELWFQRAVMRAIAQSLKYKEDSDKLAVIKEVFGGK